MATQQIVATTLPAGTGVGATAPTLRFSVHISPRLVPASTLENALASFPLFEIWPAIMPNSMIIEQFDASLVPTGSGFATAISAAPDLSLWQALFLGSMPVEPFAPTAFVGKYGSATFRSFPAKALHEYQTKFLTDLLVSHETDAPTPTQLLGLLGSASKVGDPNTAKDVSAAIETALGSGRQTPPWGRVAASGSTRPLAGTANEALADHLQLLTFLEPRTSATYLAANPTVNVPKIDFHRAVALLQDHPQLLRQLGLVADYEVKMTLAKSTRWVRVSVEMFGNAAADVVTPLTAVVPPTFLAAPKSSSFITTDRMVDLTAGADSQKVDGWGVVSLDVEGTALKTANLAHTYRKVAALPPGGGSTPATVETPAPRHGGLRLLRADRAKDVVQSLQRSASLLAASPGDAKLYLDDLVRGYRVDVWDEERGKWYALTRRDLSYLASRASISIGAPDDTTGLGYPALFLNEGVITTAMTSTADPSVVNPDMHISESLVEWSGWSLVAPKPGKALTSDGGNATTADPDPTHPDLALTIGVTPTRGSLPALRFGHHYRFRLRTADLAGNGPSLGTAGALGTNGHPTALTPYLRFDPLPPPALAQQAPLSMGEAMAELVTRSVDEADTLDASVRSTRHAVPPAASAHTVELHGALDGFANPANSYALLQQRDGQTLGVGPSPVWMSSSYVGVADPSSTDAVNPTPFFTDPVVQPPWLVDPAISGMRLRASGIAEHAVNFDPVRVAEWYNARGWQISLVPKPMGTAFGFHEDLVARTVEVWVPQGEQFDVSLSSVPTASMVDHLAGVSLLKTKNPAGLAARLDRVAKGTNRQVTPSAAMRFVHAVQIPLRSPSVLAAGLVATRSSKSTAASVAGTLSLHPKSTSRVDIHLDWVDPIDTEASGPTTTEGSATLPPVQVAYPPVATDPSTAPFSGLLQEFGDTKHRKVKVTATGTSRYASYFARNVTIPLSIAPTGIIAGAETGVQPRTERVVELATGKVLSPVDDYVVDTAAGTIAARATSPYVSSTVVVRFVPTPVTRSTDAGAEQVLHVPSSSPPAAPVVADVLPVFDDGAWLSYPALPAKRTGVSRKRDGRTLRVYLDRPWYSSGADEHLGVVLARSSAMTQGAYTGVVTQSPAGGSPRPAAQQVTSAWGRDPLVPGDPVDTNLTVTDFPLAANSPLYGKWVLGFNVPGTTTPAIVVPHAVAFDASVGKWYCDISVRLGNAYRPFIRLALVRFQPYALPTSHLSTATLVDAAQLSPTRTVTITGSGTLRRVSVSGPAYSSAFTGLPNEVAAARNSQFQPGPLVQVQVQRRQSGGSLTSSDPDVGWADVVGRLYTLTQNPTLAGDGATRFLADGVDISVPAGYERRIVVREYERDTRPLVSSDYRQRLVFADSLVIG